jgi:hypothetical protein
MVKTRLVDHKSISGRAWFVTFRTGETRAADMLCLYMILHVRNLPRVVATFCTFPTADLVSEHQVADKNVQTFQRFSISSLTKWHYGLLADMSS